MSTLVGKRFCDLTIIEELEPIFKGKRRHRVWLCLCNRCGAKEEFIDYKIASTPSNEKRRGVKFACTICSRGPCEVCEGKILTSIYKGVCSEECWLERRRARDRENKKKMAEKDPYFNKKNNQKRMERIYSDPEKLKTYQEKELERSRRRWSDSEERERMNANSRRRYELKKDEILARRRKRNAALTSEERLLRDASRRKQQRAYREENSERINEKRLSNWDSLTDEKRDNIREQRREAARAWKQKKDNEKALKELMSIGDNLIKKIEGSSDED